MAGNFADGKSLRNPNSSILDEIGPPITADERLYVAQHVVNALHTVKDSRVVCEMLGLFDPQISEQSLTTV